MQHYTTHGGRLHHLQAGPGLEEQVLGDASYFVATSREAFEGADIVAARRHKPGVCQVLVRRGNTCLTVYARDELLPSGPP